MAQDRRIEDVIRGGGPAIVDALGGELPAEVRPIWDLYRGTLAGTLVSTVLAMLRDAGLDTSAHVTAPHVGVHVHRDPPHDTET